MPEIIIDPAKTCCFTGHRPDHLPEDFRELYSRIDTAVRQAVDDGYNTFLTGMAIGFDRMAGYTVLQLKHRGFPVRLICAVPYKGFAEGSRDEWRELSLTLLEQADAVEYICPKSHPGCYQLRNRWMVDHSSRVIAYYADVKGGTRDTVRYAEKKNIPVTNLFGVPMKSFSP